MKKGNAEDPRIALLDEVLPRVVDFDRDSFQAALHNLSTYIEVVYREGHAADTVKRELYGFRRGLDSYYFHQLLDCCLSVLRDVYQARITWIRRLYFQYQLFFLRIIKGALA